MDRPSSPLLSVKQTIPSTRPGVVPRSRLEERLSTSAKLTVVVAPAGWGKTSMLSGWASTASAGTPVAWVSLDESDDEPVRFWSYVLTALHRAGAEISPAALEALPVSGDGPMAQTLPILLNELASSSTGHVLVLDDYHVITNSDVHESLEFLVAYLPSTLRVVIASRADPPLPLARMRVRGELVELRADDLRFLPDESAALVSAMTSVPADQLDPLVIRSLWDQTEGWAAGLQLAGLTLRTRAGSALGGAPGVRLDDRHLFDYFTTEVFPALSPAQGDLLVRTAPLELLSGSLCDAVLQVRGSAAVLAELEHADLFVVALDADRQWYRCHRLLRDALLRVPGAQPDPANQDVLLRAARWFEEQGRLDDAVRHLLRAEDHRAAERILRSEESWFLERGLAATYLALGAALPESVIDPQLALSLAYATDVSGHWQQAAHWLDICDATIDEHTVIDGWQSPRAAALAARGVLATPVSQADRSAVLCEEALALETAAGSDPHPFPQVAVGRAYGLAGRFEEGTRLLMDSWRRRGSNLWWLGVDLKVASMLALFLLGLDKGEDLDRMLAEVGPEAAATERDWGDGAAQVVTLLRLAEGRRSYQRGDPQQAAEQLKHGLRLAEISGRPLFWVVGLVFLADVELATGDRPAARAALVQARDINDGEPVPAFAVAWLAEAEARIGRVAVRAATGSGSLLEALTDREMSILRLLPGTATQREIGSALYLSINTVKAYNKSLYRKLGVSGRQDAVRTAHRLGLI